MMKKIISLILAVAMMACVCVPAFAATTYTWTLEAYADYDRTANVGTLNVGDMFYLVLKSSAGYKGFSVLLDIDTDVFEVALYDGADDVGDAGSYNIGAVMNPFVLDAEGNATSEKLDDKMSFTAVTGANRPAKTDSYIGLQVKEGAITGDYTIAVSADNSGIYNIVNVQNNDSVNVGANAITVSVKGTDPVVPPTPEEPEEPETPDEPVVGDAPVVAEKAKTWTVNIDADYVAANDTLVATLYNTEDAADKQEVTLSIGEGVVEGGAGWSFALKANFNNAEMMSKIALAVAKAN